MVLREVVERAAVALPPNTLRPIPVESFRMEHRDRIPYALRFSFIHPQGYHSILLPLKQLSFGLLRSLQASTALTLRFLQFSPACIATESTGGPVKHFMSAWIVDPPGSLLR